jgi:NAD(P)-dependent dehydrogenase (short-subunit alcohol dehydrogenase family)
MSGRLKGKVAIVTGAASGIGLAIAEAFAREGAKLGLVDRDGQAVAKAAASLPGRAAFAQCDVADAAAVTSAFAAIHDAIGPANVLVNNAGVSISGGLEEMSEAEWDLTFNVNVKAIYLASRIIIPQMRALGGGSIINMASESAFIGFAMHPAYCASKAAVVHLCRSMAARYAKDGIRTNALCPGTIDTPLYRKFLAQQADPDSINKMVEAMHPLGIGTAKDIAHAAVYLASDESRYATGAPFLIDGGATAI